MIIYCLASYALLSTHSSLAVDMRFYSILRGLFTLSPARGATPLPLLPRDSYVSLMLGINCFGACLLCSLLIQPL